MPIPIRQRINTPYEDLEIMLTDDGSRTVAFAAADVAYHSGCGAAAETRCVYLENSGIADRLRSGHASTVLEVGLGTAMAALMTIDMAQRHEAPLRYVALENRLLNAATLRLLHLGNAIANDQLASSFMDWLAGIEDSLDDKSATGRTLTWQPYQQIQLIIELADVRRWQTPQPDRFDAVFFDPFGPETSPQLWDARVLRQMHRAMKRDGRLTTYCVNRGVRDTMATVGLACQRVPGPIGGKREVLIARKSSADC